ASRRSYDAPVESPQILFCLSGASMNRTVRRSSDSLLRLSIAVVLAGIASLIFTADRRVRAASTFTPGNLVIYRVGTGALGANLVNTGNPIFLDEYTPSGTLVQSVPLPTAPAGANHQVIASGTATSEGLITRSTDGRFIVASGYDAPIPTSGLVSTSLPRVV